MAGRGWETLQNVREQLGDLPERPGAVGRPSRKDGSGWETLLKGREGSVGPPAGTRGIRRPF